MRAKRSLIDTLLPPSSPSSYSLPHTQLSRGALLSIDLQLLGHSEFFKVQFSKTVFSTMFQTWIAAMLFLGGGGFRLCASNNIKCLRQINLKPQITPVLRWEYNQSLLADMTPNHKK